MLDLPRMATLTSIGLVVGALSGWLVWGRSADLATEVLALAEEHCLQPLMGRAKVDLDAVLVHEPTGARISFQTFSPQQPAGAMACRIMEFDQRWSNSEKAALARDLEDWAYEVLAPLNEGDLITVTTEADSAVFPSYVWRSAKPGLSHFAFIYTHDEGRISVINIGRGLFVDSAEHSGSIADA
ncbi:MAG: hypothetical protein P1U53_06045 [Sulfitobacter sp.]|nr:hypothetical protein [Sulfitobacter sp.]